VGQQAASITGPTRELEQRQLLRVDRRMPALMISMSPSTNAEGTAMPPLRQTDEILSRAGIFQGVEPLQSRH
jgi:hypothetical protein